MGTRLVQRDLWHLAASHLPLGDASLPAPGLTLAWGCPPLATCYESHLHLCSPAGLPGQGRDRLPRGAMGDAGCRSTRAPRRFWQTSVLSLMVEGVSGCYAEEGDGQAGVDASWRLGELGVRVGEGGKNHLGGVSH